MVPRRKSAAQTLSPSPLPRRSQMVKILTEDKAMVERLRPEALEREFSLAPDGPQVAFRNLRAEWMTLPGYASRHGLARAPSAGTDASHGGDM